MKLEKLKLKDFLTYEELEYDFESRPLMIQGRNLTDEGQASNGSGKSGIQTGIEFCITASNSRGVRDNELISYGQSEAKAELVVSCDVRKERLHIDWTIKLKGSNLLTLTKQPYGGDWEEVSFSNVNDGKKWIVDWFGISKEDLFNYFLINKARFKSFFESSNREKVALINRFSDASIIEGVDNIDTSDLEREFRSLEDEKVRIETKIEIANERIISEKSRDLEEEFEEIVEDIDYEISENRNKIREKESLIQSLERDIEGYFEEIELIKKEIKKEERYLEPIEEEIEEVSQKTKEAQILVDEARELVDGFKGLDLSGEKLEIEEEIEENNSLIRKSSHSVSNLENSKQTLLKKIQEVNLTLSGTITCPSCKHEFLNDSSADIDELSGKLKSYDDLIVKVDEKVASEKSSQKILKEDIDSFLEEIKELRKREESSLEGKSQLIENLNELSVALSNHQTKARRLENQKNLTKDSIRDLEGDITQSGKSIDNLKIEIGVTKDFIKGYEDLISQLEVKKKGLQPIDNSKLIETLNEDLSALKSTQDSLNLKLSYVGDDIYKMNQWKNNFKQFRLHLANQSLEVMEYHSNRYLSEMGSDLKVKFEGYKTLANGSIKDEITSKIIRNRERSYSSFSGGEKGRLLFSSILANRYMINKTHPYGGLDFLSIDEIFEGVDAVGLKSLIKSAKQLQIAVMIITHVTDENVSDDILMIEKEGGVSRIVNN